VNEEAWPTDGCRAKTNKPIVYIAILIRYTRINTMCIS